jgi:uncharacterized protein YbjT (DUF2867 family)
MCHECKSREINVRTLKPGTQGGSIANSLLATGHYRVRGLTRKPESDKAKALAYKGAEVVKCDLSVKEDIESALKGADVAWIVTNFLDPVRNFVSYELCNK